MRYVAFLERPSTQNNVEILCPFVDCGWTRSKKVSLEGPCCLWEEAAKQNSNDWLFLNTLQLVNMSDPPFYRHCSVWNNLLEWEITFTVFPHFGILFQQLNDSLAQIKDQSTMFSMFWTLLTSPDTSTWSCHKKMSHFVVGLFWQKFCELWNCIHPTGN